MAKEGKIVKPSDGKMPEQILFIQCAGSRDEKHLPYCSNYCCGTSLKQAQYIKEQSKDTAVFVVYKDIRTPGSLKSFIKKLRMTTRYFLQKGNRKCQYGRG